MPVGDYLDDVNEEEDLPTVRGIISWLGSWTIYTGNRRQAVEAFIVLFYMTAVRPAALSSRRLTSLL